MNEPTAQKPTWTGQRMFPHESDPTTEMFRWQQYLYFRPWYAGARVVDAASGEGYGLGYAATFAQSGLGYDNTPELTEYSRQRYPHANFKTLDVCEADYSEADLVTSFETIEHLTDPKQFLRSLAACKGRIVISTPNRNTHSPGNQIGDKPLNVFHTVEWTSHEFADLINESFPQHRVRFLSQENRWPGIIREGLDAEAAYTIAVIGEGELPSWPRIGLAMPTCDGAQRVSEAIFHLTKFYPGEIEIAVIANGSGPETLSTLRKLAQDLPHVVRLVESPTNLGYGRGANLGLDRLLGDGTFDLFGVINDDVIPSVDCVCQMVSALDELQQAGLKPGMIGPVSNSVNGAQQVDIGPFQDLRQMMRAAEAHHSKHHTAATKALQVRGLFLLITRECLSEVGGFDPRFGLGNFEDDDLNLRARLAGFSLWIADGAFLYHSGSATFGELGINYGGNIARNIALFLEKWRVTAFDDALMLTTAPDDLPLFVPLDAEPDCSGFSMTLGNETFDLVYQATEAEFGAWITLALRKLPREARYAVLDSLNSSLHSRELASA